MAKGADCKSAGLAFVGSSPTSPTIIGTGILKRAGHGPALSAWAAVVIVGAALRRQCPLATARRASAGRVRKITNIPGAMPHISGM